MKKLKEKEMKYIIYFMIIVFAVSSFSFLGYYSSDSSSDDLQVSLAIIGLSENYAQNYSVPKGANLYYLLYQTGYVTFQSDYSVKCVGSTCNDYKTKSYWQVFLDDSKPNMDYAIFGGEEFILYYGDIINFINITVELNVDEIFESNIITLPDYLNAGALISNYNATYENGSIACIFNMCGEWNLTINGNEFNDSYIFSENDVLSMELSE